MEREEFEALQVHLRTVERKLHRVVTGWMVSLVLLVVLGAWVQQAVSQPAVVRARRVEIADDAGQARITLDAVGRRPNLWLYDSSGRKRIGLAVLAEGIPVFWLLDAEERRRIELSVLPDGAAAVVLSDSPGRTRMLFKVGADGTPTLSLSEPLGRPRILLKVLDNGIPGFWLFDATGEVRFSAP